MKLKKLSTGPLQDERACIRGLEYIFSQILRRIYLLDSLDNLAWIGLIRLSCLAGRFYGLQSRTSNQSMWCIFYTKILVLEYFVPYFCQFESCNKDLTIFCLTIKTQRQTFFSASLFFANPNRPDTYMDDSKPVVCLRTTVYS